MSDLPPVHRPRDVSTHGAIDDVREAHIAALRRPQPRRVNVSASDDQIIR